MNIENKINIIEEEINDIHKEIKNLCANEKFIKSLKIAISNLTVYINVKCNSYYKNEYSGPLSNCNYILNNFSMNGISVDFINMLQINMRKTISLLYKDIALILDKKISIYEKELADYKKSFFLKRNFMYVSENNLNYFTKIRNEHYENLISKGDAVIYLYKFINLISSVKPLMVKLNNEKIKLQKKLLKEKNILSKQNEIELNHGKAYAKSASLDKNNRRRAKTVLKVLKITENCPYCENVIGDNPHDNHINTISSGGLSSLENMIYVCSACNNKKGEKGLLEFIITNNHDISRVYHTLKSLGKKI